MTDIFIEMISGILKGVFGFLWEIAQAIFQTSPKRKETLDADFLHPGSLLSAYNHGFSLNGNQSLTTKDSHLSAMVLGGSGSGKSANIALPTIFNLSKHGHSMVIHDPSMELHNASAPALAARGYNIKILHYSNPGISDGYNPMARANDTSAINKVASLLVRSALGENNKDPFWGTQAMMLISLAMRILKKQNFWYQHLSCVKLILDNMTAANPDAIDLLVAQCYDRQILTEYQQFVAMDKKLFVSVASTARTALSLWMDPDIQTVTAFDSIEFDSFRTEKTVLFINNKTGDMKYYAPLSAIFFEQFFGHIMERLPSKDERSIFFILDEASSLYMPTLQIALANLRKFKAGIMCIGQDFNQFIHLYGTHEAEAIRSNCYAKIYMPGQPLATAQELERLLGTFEFEDKNGNRRTRPLMTADEIRVMKPNTALIIAGPNRAIHTKMYPYFKNLKYRSLSKLPLPIHTNKTPFEELPLIPLPTPQPKTERK